MSCYAKCFGCDYNQAGIINKTCNSCLRRGQTTDNYINSRDNCKNCAWAVTCLDEKKVRPCEDFTPKSQKMRG